jgi:prepilin-type N-terminal cleavage/methylation domain-containing protein
VSILRRGFTLIELVAVLAIMGLVADLISATLGRQQRLYRAASEALDTRRSVRDGIAILSEEIRGASAADTIRLMSDSAIELFTAIGSSVACGSLSAADVGLAPMSATGVPLTTWLTVPDTGDLALLYRTASSTPGAWERFRILSVTSRSASTACPSASGFGGGGGSSYLLTLSPAPAVISPGAPLRFIRRGRYSLYKSSDGKWYVGYRRCNAIGASKCGSIQPLSGSYQPYSADTARTGLLLRYFDSTNQPLSGSASALRVARIQIITRSVSGTPVIIDAAPRTARDSAVISVALRNLP